jgi:hypothetical protein
MDYIMIDAISIQSGIVFCFIHPSPSEVIESYAANCDGTIFSTHLVKRDDFSMCVLVEGVGINFSEMVKIEEILQNYYRDLPEHEKNRLKPTKKQD